MPTERGKRVGGFPHLPAARPDQFRRAGRASGIFPRRVRRPPPLARRGGLCRHRRAVPVPAGAGKQPDRDQPRHPAGRAAGGVRRVARLYDAVGARADPVRLRRHPLWRSVARRLAARAEDRRGRGGGAGGVGHGAQPVPRSRARDDRGRRGRTGTGRAVGGRPGRRNRRRRADRLGPVGRLVRR